MTEHTHVPGPSYYSNGSLMSGTRAVDTHLTAEEGSTDIWSCKDAREKADQEEEQLMST